MSKLKLGLLRMGSGASNNVKSINIDQDSDKYDRPKSGKERKALEKDFEVSGLRAKLAKCQEDLMIAEEKAVDAEAEARQLEKQMSELESTNVDLNERIQSLEEKIQYMDTQNLIADNAPAESLKVKDQVIDKLQKRTREIEDEINTLKGKYKKKLRRVNSQLAESKQDTTNKVFELKGELAKKDKDNARLEERLSRANSASSRQGNDELEDRDSGVGCEDNRTKIIIELSGQVSDQLENISSLEQELKYKDLVIEQLKIRLKENGINSKIENETDLTQGSRVITGSASRRKKTDNLMSKNYQMSGNLEDATKESAELSIARERRRMKKGKNHEKSRETTEDFRQSSGTSHDSGVMDASAKPPSAGKRRKQRTDDLHSHDTLTNNLSIVSETGESQVTGSRVNSAHSAISLNSEECYDLETDVGPSVSQESLQRYLKHSSRHLNGNSKQRSSGNVHDGMKRYFEVNTKQDVAQASW